ncbi:uncharacterized protein BDZ99DRAFT_561494 [Mytilinidion resinicola]|uniref:Uncharacterized protein n=1 Tax=Mytilinidion resinicola TaxID=574789 RepID=A0A6A6YSF2_9PEZI|nr:uncharacterized protein BDZ99DRAFT_561494 [Mytilinidion resinicola]KAF2810895.1 hypothetical protein BDZ99DRAFT_561494 [Mytilinidion resinicola]
MDDYAEDRFRERMMLIENELLSVKDGRAAGDPESLRALSDATRRCFDDEKVRISFIATQVINIDMKVEKAILDALQIYKRIVTRATLSNHGADFIPVLSPTKGTLAAEVCTAVVASFGLPTINASTVEHIISFKLWKAPVSSTLAVADAVSKAFLTTLSIFDPCSAPAIVIDTVQANTKLFLALVCDVILILVKAFKGQR